MKLALRMAGPALALASLAMAGILVWGGDLLVTRDSLPARAEALVVLKGSLEGEEARRQEAARLLREGRAAWLALSTPQATYLGEWVPDLMRRHLERSYGSEPARRAVMCPHRATSTIEEAQALLPCLQQRGWRTLIVVTSNYHTRRAGRIWRRAFRDADPPVRVFLHGVADGDFEPHGWWRSRRHAKTFLAETSKLAWAYLFE